MSDSSGHQEPTEREINASLLYDVAEAICLGYPLIVVIGEIPGDERNPDILASSHFDGLERGEQERLIESAVVELRKTLSPSSADNARVIAEILAERRRRH